MSPPLSLAICSNRPPTLLPRLLERLAAQPELEPMPLLWVDNTPGSPQGREIQALLERRRHTRYLQAPEPGLSQARNLATSTCQTPWLAFLDDDALPRPGWTQHLLPLLEGISPQTAMLGGPVLPVWPHPPPTWLDTSLAQLLALVRWDPAPAILRPGQWLAGANMILRTEPLRRMGGFPTHLGRRGRNLLSMEELALGYALEQAGYHRCYLPELEVEHVLDPGRLCCRWFWKRSWWQGVSEALAPRIPREPHPRPYHLLPPPGIRPHLLPRTLMRGSCHLLRLLGHLTARGRGKQP